MKSKNLLLILFSFVINLNSFSQEKEFDFKNLTQENGLPSNESYFVYRDSKDFLWFASDQGVVRYNGSKMEQFNLPDNVVFKIREDSKGRIWFFSRTGKLSYFFNGSIYPYQYNDSIAKHIDNILISDAYVNDNDEIIINSGQMGRLVNYKITNSGEIQKISYNFLGTNKLSLFRITRINKTELFTQKVSFSGFRYDSIAIELVTENQATKYTIPWTGFFSTQYGSCTINGRHLFFFNNGVLAKLNEDGSFKIKYFPWEIISCRAIDNHIWLGFIKHGFVVLDSNLNEIYKDPVLKDKSVTSIRKDHEGGLWFSTLEKGIFYLKNPGISRLSGDSSLTGPIFRIYNSGDCNFLYANATGIYRIRNNFKPEELLHHNSSKINDLFVDNDRNIYFSGTIDLSGCLTGCTYKKSNHTAYNNSFILTSYSEMLKLRGDDYLVSSYGQIMHFRLGQKFTPYNNTHCILYDSTNKSIPNPGIPFTDSKNQIWMGTINGLYQFTSFATSLVQFKPYDTLFRKGITAIKQMGNGIYCFGIRFGGIALMQDTTIIARITENDRLLSNSVKNLLILNNQLWAVTPKGISVIWFHSFSPVKYTITNIGKNDGLYNLIIYQLMPYHGNMFAATSSGIYEIGHPELFLARQPKPIPFYINSISYYKGDTSQVSSITLPHNNSRIVIRYSAVCYNLPDEVKYYYRFNNADTTWHEIVSTELSMENLIPGTYELEIKASIPVEQCFSKIQKIRIVVEKPWWQNDWLKVLITLIVLVVVYVLYTNRIRKITAQEQQKTALQTKMHELEQTALRSQMNPHFIFNCLTSIQQLITTGNKDEANEYLVKFARLIRKTLELSAYPFTSVEEESSYLKEYLVLEQLRIPGQFEFDIQVDPTIDSQRTKIPNMILQPLIENSIRHGIRHLHDKRGYIAVTLKKEGQYILCSVTDNGIGRKKKKEAGENMINESKSYGMEIINNRLEIFSSFYNTESVFEIEDLFDKEGIPAGTKVNIKLPFKLS